MEPTATIYTGIKTLCYLLGALTFIIGLKMMGSPRNARKGNAVAAFGMLISILASIFLHTDQQGALKSISPGVYGVLSAALLCGTLIGWYTAKKVQMTKMPELVSMFNGMGGACAALISIIELQHLYQSLSNPLTGLMFLLNGFPYGLMATIIAGLVIGSVSFSGSVIAYLKLNGTLSKPIRFSNYNVFNTAFLILLIGYAAYFVLYGGTMASAMLIFIGALAYGVLFTVPIGGADMPVVISLLNSFTGLAAAFGGFLYDNKVMLTGGILVGSAGTLLTLVMCKAMNRSLSSVIFGAFGSTAAASGATEVKGSTRDLNASDIAVLMNYSKKVVIVPGYGLAVAQAQHTIKELETLLEDRGVEVKYAIHPVAGRMPGHMNVLLAESNVSYDKLVEMDDINPEFEQTDVVLVVGANDVVNPAAKTDPASPIYGMPILEVNRAQHIIVNKRSMNAGYAGIDNLLFYDPKCAMFFGDAKKALTELISEIKAL